MIVCKNCGKEHSDNSKFCDNCGAPLAKTPSEQANTMPSVEENISVEEDQFKQPTITQMAENIDMPENSKSEQGSYQPTVQQPITDQQNVYQAPDTVQGAYQPQQVQGDYQAPVQQPITDQQNVYQAPDTVQGAYQPQQVQGDYQPPVQQPITDQQNVYQAPNSAQGAYQPQQAYTGQQTAVKQKKPINPKIFIFIGVAIAVIAIIVLVISLVGGKGKADSDDSYLGVWDAVTVEMFGEEYNPEEVIGKLSIEFKKKGKCEFRVDDDKDNYKWKETETDLQIISKGETIITCIKEDDSLLIENFMETGLKIVFEREGAKSSKNDVKVIQDNEEKVSQNNEAKVSQNNEETNEVTNNTDVKGESSETQSESKETKNASSDVNTKKTDSPNSVQKKWNGSWYGYFYVSDAFGEWEGYEDALLNAYMVFDIGADGNGTMAIFLEDSEFQSIDCYVFADDYHVEVTEGEFWDYDLDPTNWWLGISPAHEGNLVVIADVYLDPELTDEDGFEYMFMFRPWGELWEEEAKKVKDGEIGYRIPPNYDDYVEAIENGVADPNGFDD